MTDFVKSAYKCSYIWTYLIKEDAWLLSMWNAKGNNTTTLVHGSAMANWRERHDEALDLLRQRGSAYINSPSYPQAPTDATFVTKCGIWSEANTRLLSGIPEPEAEPSLVIVK